MPQSGQLNCSFRIASSITSLRNLLHLPLPVRDEAIVFCLCCDSLFVCCVRTLCVCYVARRCAQCVLLAQRVCCVWCVGWAVGVWVWVWALSRAPALSVVPYP